MRLTWAQPEDLVPAELVALREQGVREGVIAPIERRWAEAGGSTALASSGASADTAPAARRLLGREILAELQQLQTDSSREPNEWAAIVALLPEPYPVGAAPLTFERVYGAWLGRAAGCLLGKPVEKIPREGIEAIARESGNWPIRQYFTGSGLSEATATRWPWNRRSANNSLVENIDGMPEDDDLNFAILALETLEIHGDALTTDDVADAWLAALPAGRVFTAERVAYRNLLDARPVPETATYCNPFREWIGALIRADVHGWSHPGDARAAAASAWIDARLSHTRNGMYGAMWAAALCSAALAQSSIDDVLDAGDSVVPPTSRLHAAVQFGRATGRSLRAKVLEPEAALDRLQAEFAGLHWVHTLNNAALIACALQAYGEDFGRAVAFAVAGGWDTDSAGATVGSIAGALAGSERLDAAWVAPIGDRVATSLPGGAERSIRELAGRTYRLAGGFP